MIRFNAQQADAATMSVRIKADGVDQTAHTLTLTANLKPTTEKARVGSKGVALPVEITSNDDIKISTVEVAAKMLRQPW